MTKMVIYLMRLSITQNKILVYGFKRTRKKLLTQSQLKSHLSSGKSQENNCKIKMSGIIIDFWSAMKYLEHSAGTPDQRLNRLLWLCVAIQYMADTLKKALKAWHLHLHNTATSVILQTVRQLWEKRCYKPFIFLNEKYIEIWNTNEENHITEILLGACHDMLEGFLSSPWIGRFHIRYSYMDIATQK